MQPCICAASSITSIELDCQSPMCGQEAQSTSLPSAWQCRHTAAETRQLSDMHDQAHGSVLRPYDEPCLG